MRIKWLTLGAVLCLCIGAGYLLFAQGNSTGQRKYVVFNPPVDEMQKAVDQQQEDQHVAKK
jgi:uncharacterized membrane protein YdfJ with MMPL/SSD domain